MKKRIDSRIYKVQKYINLFIRTVLIIASVLSVVFAKWSVLFISLLTFILTFLPLFFKKRYKITIPVEFQILIVLFVYAAIFLGEVRGFYARFWWWDVVLHTGSAIGFGIVGFMILFVLYKGGKLKANPFWIAVFSFTFAMAIGGLWEIFEFGMDQIFGLNMQKSGIVDTMWDLIVDGLGGLFAATLGYFYLKGESKFSFDKIMKTFVKKNPQLFKNS